MAPELVGIFVLFPALLQDRREVWAVNQRLLSTAEQYQASVAEQYQAIVAGGG